MTDAALLRAEAAGLAGALPPLLADARQLAAAVALGVHGRRRPGMGESFWQFRRAHPGDTQASVDWRASARSDALFIRQTEWEAAQTVGIWVDDAQAMDFAAGGRPTKHRRAAVLGLALADLLVQAGERVALLGTAAGQPRAGRAALNRMALALADPPRAAEYGVPPVAPLPAGAKVVLISDFLGDWPAILEASALLAAGRVTGAFLQVLDDSEEAFPFDGRTRFESMGGGLRHETERADGLRDAYRARLTDRQAALAEAAAATGWRIHTHHTGDSAQAALLWLYGATGALPS